LTYACGIAVVGSVTPLAEAGRELPDYGLLGTIPAWVSAILTGAAFSVTFLLFRRESEDRLRKQADAVYAWQTSGPDVEGECDVTVTVYNDSEGPIWAIDVRLMRNKAIHRARPRESGSRQLRPGKEATWSWTIASGDAQLLGHPSVAFDDASGRRWERTASKLVKPAPNWKGRIVKRPLREVSAD
jgi:hypothetical protein